LFLPNSTWAQGRNFLLEHVLKNNYSFDYLVFIDGDAKPIKGSWREFNNFILNKRPQICVPLTHFQGGAYLGYIIKKLSFTFPLPLWQRALNLDEQVQAFRNDIIINIGNYFYPTTFDNISWRYNAHIHNQMLRYLAPYNIVQFNALAVENNSHISYPFEYNCKFIRSYIKNMGLLSMFPCFSFRDIRNRNLTRAILLLNVFIELFYLIPFPIKEFDAAKRGEYIKRMLSECKKK
jgi:hypothetical protein